MASDTIIKITGVSKLFSNSIQALRDFSLSVKKDEFVSLVGPNGCGKSTILRIIAGLIKPTDGILEVLLSNSNKLKKDNNSAVGFVFQKATLMPWATVFNNVWLPLRLNNITKREAQPIIMEHLELLGLAQFANSYPKELSGGMSMLVSIARALVLRPQLLLMDEPFSALDEITRFKLNDVLLRIHVEKKIAIILVTHSIYEAVYLSNRVILMSSRPGRVLGNFSVESTSTLRCEDFRNSPMYHYCYQTISSKLKEHMKEGTI